MMQAILILCLVILPFNLMSILLSFRTMSNLQHSYRQSLMISLSTYAEQLNERMDNSNYLLYNYPSSDSSFISMLLNEQDWHHSLHRNNVYTSIRNTLRRSNSADAMFVYLPEIEEFLLINKSTQNGTSSSAILSEQELTELSASPDMSNGKWHLYEYDENQFLIRIVPNQTYYFGAYINCSDLLSVLQNDLIEERADAFLSDTMPEEKSGYLLCSAPLSNKETSLHCMVQNFSIFNHNYLSSIGMIAFFLLSVLMVPVFIILFRKQVNRPLTNLKNAFHQLEKGNEDYRITETSSSSEFLDTIQSFNAMAENTSILKNKALEEEKHRHELTVHNLSLRLDNLQLQIRPHFLQNMMNLLFTLVQNHQEDNAKRLILYLSQYFRYMFRYGHDLELFDKEINLVKEYLSISEMHYTNAFTVSYQLDPLLSLMRFPPLLLHNFVENIIQHALIPGRTIHIVLYGEYDEDNHMVTLQISDDGRGMSEEYAAMINRNDFSSVPVGKHIGIRNSINRLMHYYDGKASVSVETIPDGGTTVTIMIPQNLTMEDLDDE